MTPEKKLMLSWILVGVVVVIVAAILYFGYFSSNGGFGQAVYAPQGQAVQGFPRNLLLDSTAKISASYAVPYSSSTQQYTVEWDSDGSPQGVIAGYTLYFFQNGWRIINQTTSSEDVQAVYAADISGTLNVVASQKTGSVGSAVTVSFVPAANASVPVAPQSLPASFPNFLMPDPAAKLIAAQSNASSVTATFRSKLGMAQFAQSLLASLASNHWTVTQKQTAFDAAYVSASQAAASVFETMNTIASGTIEIEVRYIAP